jgi:hypothetical protein
MSEKNKKNEDWFWQIIQYARSDREELRKALDNFSKEDLVDFQTFFVDLSAELQDEPFLDYMEESEDGAEDIAHWVVSKGKNFYEDVIADPSKVPHSVEGRSGEILYGVANEVYYNKFKETIDIY